MYKKSLYNFINPLSDSESVRNFESCKNEECEKKKKTGERREFIEEMMTSSSLDNPKEKKNAYLAYLPLRLARPLSCSLFWFVSRQTLIEGK